MNQKSSVAQTLKFVRWALTSDSWFYLSTILDDYSRYIIAWKLCTTMKAADVTDTLDLALETSGCDNATVVHKPRLLSELPMSCATGSSNHWRRLVLRRRRSGRLS